MSVKQKMSIKGAIKNLLINFQRYNPISLIKQLFFNPRKLFQHPAEKLFKAVPLLLYQPNFDFLKICKSELCIDAEATLFDVQKECLSIYSDYIA